MISPLFSSVLGQSTMAPSSAAKSGSVHRSTSSRSRSKIEKSCGSEEMMFYQDIFGRIPKYTPPSYTSVFADTMLQQTISPSYVDEYLPRQKASSNIKKVSLSPVHASEPHKILVNVTGTGNSNDNDKFGRSEGHVRINAVSYDDVFGGISSISVSSSGPEILSDLLGNKGNQFNSSSLNITKDSYFSGEAPLNVAKPASPTFIGSFKDSAPFAKDNELLNSIKDSNGDITMAKNGVKKLTSSMREEAQEEGVDPSFFKNKSNHRNSKLKEHTYSTGIEQNHVRKDYRSHGEVRKHKKTKSLRSPKIHKPSLKSEASIPSIAACQLPEDDMFWISISEVKLITEPSASLPPVRPPPLPSSRTKMAPHESLGIMLPYLNVVAAGNTTVSSASEEFVKDVLEGPVEGINDVSTLMAEEMIERNRNMSASAMNVTNDSMDVTKEAIDDGSAMDVNESADVTKESTNDGFAMDINEESMDVTKEGMKDGSKVEMEKLKDISVSMAEEKVKGSTSKITSTMDMAKETMDITNMCIMNASNDISASMADEKVEESWSTLESSADITKESMDVTKERMEDDSRAEIEKTNVISASVADGKMEESTYMTTLTMDTTQERIDVTKEVMMDSSKAQINGIKDGSASMTEEMIEGSTSTMYITKESIDVRKAANNHTNKTAERDIPEIKEDEESEGAAVPQSEHLEQNGALEDFQVMEEGRGEEKEEKPKNEIKEIEAQKENGVIESYQKAMEGGGCLKFTTKEAILESNDRQPLKFKMEDRKTEEEVTGEDETKDGETDDVFLDCEYLEDEDNAKESVVLGEPKVKQDARGTEKDEKHRNERQDVEMEQKEKEPPERHENERETQGYAAKESNKETILILESIDQQQYRIKLEDRKTGNVMISQGEYPGKEDKARENVIMGALKAAKEGKGNKKGEKSKIEIETEQSEKQEQETHPKERESQQYGTKESIQKNISGLKDVQDDRLKPNKVQNEEKEKHLGKEHRAREGNTMGSLRAEQEGRGQELGEKQVKGREKTVRIEKDKEARERHEKEKEERERQREREKDRISIEMFTREAHERARERERASADTWEKAAADFRERKAKSLERANSFSKESENAPFKERANTNALLQERLNVADAREKARAALYRANAEMLERSVVERAASEARARALRAAVARVKSDIRDRASSPSSIQSNKSSPSGSFRKVVSTMPTRSGPLFYDATSFNVSSASVEFQETEGEPTERRKARWERHQRTVERAAKALEEKNERDRQAQREQAERHRIAQIVDTDIKRWVAGKEGNLRALLSTLQYILWREAGWKPVPLTDLLAAASVKKAYRKATLCVHPDKVQQKGATVQQKYIAEKVFDLLKEAWNKFASDEML